VVGSPLSHLRCYLAEWYWPQLTEELLENTVARLDECVRGMCAAGSPVQLLTALAVPNDELIFGVFAAGSKQVVTRVCRQAGIPAQRISPAIDARGVRQT
jgi:hypothetical protein